MVLISTLCSRLLTRLIRLQDATMLRSSRALRALSNHKVLIDSFLSIYGANQGRIAGKAAAVGRYPEDVFHGWESLVC